jgi:hypothetical protein
MRAGHSIDKHSRKHSALGQGRANLSRVSTGFSHQRQLFKA